MNAVYTYTGMLGARNKRGITMSPVFPLGMPEQSTDELVTFLPVVGSTGADVYFVVYPARTYVPAYEFGNGTGTYVSLRSFETKDETDTRHLDVHAVLEPEYDDELFGQSETELPRDLADRLDYLMSLPEGWDTYGGHRISQIARWRAIEVISRLLALHRDSETAPPFISPSPDGGLSIEWSAPSGKTLIVDVAAGDGSDTFLVSAGDGMILAEPRDARHALAEFLS